MGFGASKEEKDPDDIIVNQWDSTAVKNAIDDAAKEITKEKFLYSEVNHLMNIRLAISMIAVGFAGFGLLYDFKEPFPKSKFVLACCSISYFVMMAVFTAFSMFMEKNIFFEGDDTTTVVGSPARIELFSSLKKYHNIFCIGIKLRLGSNSDEQVVEFPVEQYFTEEGQLLQAKLEETLSALYAKVVHVKSADQEGKKTK